MGFFWIQIVAAYTNVPLVGATVTVGGNSLTTGSDGRAKFDPLAPGTYLLTAFMPGYVTFQDYITQGPDSQGYQTSLKPTVSGAANPVTTYRGVDIYEDTTTSTFYFTVNGQKHSNYASQDVAMADIDVILGPVPGATSTTPTTPTTPTGGNMILAETYQGVPIYQDPTTQLYSFTFGFTTYPDVATLQDAEKLIYNLVTISTGTPPAAPTGTTPDGQYIGGLFGQFGNAGSLQGDPSRAAAISNGVNSMLASMGLTTAAINQARSDQDPEKAASELLTQISGLSVAAIAGLEVVGVIAEIVSLGQVETVTYAINEILDATGIKEFTARVFNIQLDRALIRPAEHYLNSVYTPEHPGPGDLLNYLFRRLITVDQFVGEMARNGFNSSYADMAMRGGYQLPGLADISDGVNKGLISMDQAGRDLARIPLNFTPWDAGDVSDGDLLWGLQKTPITKLDLRKAYLYKMITGDEYVKRLEALGFREDTQLMASIQELASIYSLQSACITQAGGKYTDGIADALKSQNAAEKVILTERDAAISTLDGELANQAITQEQYTNLKAQYQAQTDQAIAAIIAQFQPLKDQALALFKSDIARVKAETDPDNLVILRFVIAGERKTIPSDYQVITPDVTYEAG